MCEQVLYMSEQILRRLRTIPGGKVLDVGTGSGAFVEILMETLMSYDSFTGIDVNRDRLEAEQTGLHICGFGWDGIGMNEMIKQAQLTARNLIEGKPKTKDQPTAKGIYV